MAAWSSLLWHDTVDMLEHGVSFCHVPESPLFIKCNKSRHSAESPTKNKKFKNPGQALPKELFHIVSPEHVVTVKSERGIHFSPVEGLLEAKKLDKQEGLQSVLVKRNVDQKNIKSAVYTTKVQYARLGW